LILKFNILNLIVFNIVPSENKQDKLGTRVTLPM